MYFEVQLSTDGTKNIYKIITIIIMIMIIIDALVQITYRSESCRLLNCLKMI